MELIQNLIYSIRNFKILTKGDVLNIKPITILCGSNSCGKSSIIQSILLLSQSMQDFFIKNNLMRIVLGFPSRFFPKNLKFSSNLIFEGKFCHLQDFKNIIFENNLDNDLEFQWKFKYKNLEHKIILTYLGIKDEESDINKFIPFIQKIHIIRKNEEQSQEFAIDLIDKSTLSYNIKFNNPLLFDKDKFFLNPKRYDLSIEVLNEIKEYVKNKDFKFEKVSCFSITGPFSHQVHFNSPQFVNEFIKNSKKKGIEIPNDQKEEFSESVNQVLIDIVNYPIYDIFEGLIQYYRKIQYIGPLREQPKRYYQFSDSRISNLGLRGENFAHILAIQRKKNVSIIKLIKKNSVIDFSDPEDVELIDGVNYWLEEMNLQKIRIINVEIIVRIGVEYSQNQPTDSSVSLPDVGFGLSQILPVIIEVLRSKKNSTLVLEQPEIHLHPKLQAKLADFILCNAKNNKNFIIETHSDHFVKRLCLRIAQSSNDDLSKMIGIYFVVPTKDGTRIMEIEIDEFGDILNWPKGFFDESEDGLIIQAAYLKKKLKESE